MQGGLWGWHQEYSFLLLLSYPYVKDTPKPVLVTHVRDPLQHRGKEGVSASHAIFIQSAVDIICGPRASKILSQTGTARLARNLNICRSMKRVRILTCNSRSSYVAPIQHFFLLFVIESLVFFFYFRWVNTINKSEGIFKHAHIPRICVLFCVELRDQKQ